MLTVRTEKWMLEVPSGYRSSIAINPYNLSVHCNRELASIHYLKPKATVCLGVFEKDLPWVWCSVVKASQTLCVPSHFSIKMLQKSLILLWGNDIMKSKVCILLTELNFTWRKLSIPQLETSKPTNWHRYHSFPGGITGNLSYEKCRVKF